MAQAPSRLLRDGRWANARVSRVVVDGTAWVVKDFASRAWWVRNSIGRWLIGRELRTLHRLDGIDGVPAGAFRIDAHALAFGYVEGETFGKVDDARHTIAYFVALEALLGAIHRRRIVHLDTRGSGNVLVRPDGSPALIDFQSALSTRWMLPPLRRLLESVDLTGVYKKWQQADPSSMGAERAALNEKMARWRRLWMLRGYAGARKTHRP